MSRDEVLMLIRVTLEKLECGEDVPIQAVHLTVLHALRLILERDEH